jgi:hypothetical protein
VRHIRPYRESAAPARLFRKIDQSEWTRLYRPGEPTPGAHQHLWPGRVWTVDGNDLVLTESHTGNTDPVPGRHAARFLALAAGAIGLDSPEQASTVMAVVSAPELDGGDVSFQLLGDKRLHRVGRSNTVQNVIRAISRPDASTHLFSLTSPTEVGPGPYPLAIGGENMVCLLFIEDDWVLMQARVPRREGPERVVLDTRLYVCDGLAGVEQCLEGLGTPGIDNVR